MTKERLKECTLCGALVRSSMAQAHVEFHKRTPVVPKRRDPVPTVLEEPLRRPSPLSVLPHRAIPSTLPKRQHVELDDDQFPVW